MLNKDLLLAASKIKTYDIIRGTVSNVTLSYSPQTDIKAGTTVNITVTPNSGYQNPSVSVTKNDGTGGVTVSGSGNTRSFVMPKSDVTISASASVIPTYTVTGKATGGGISFSKTSGIRAGETVTVYLSPNTYYNLSSLTSSPSVSFSGSGTTRTFVMPSSNVTVSATFVAPSPVNVSGKVTHNKSESWVGDDYTMTHTYYVVFSNVNFGTKVFNSIKIVSTWGGESSSGNRYRNTLVSLSSNWIGTLRINLTNFGQEDIRFSNNKEVYTSTARLPNNKAEYNVSGTIQMIV